MITPDEGFLVCYGWEDEKPYLYVHNVKSGALSSKIPIK